MKDNIFKTEILDYASKLDAVTNSYGEIVKAASAIVEEHDNPSTMYLINHTSKLIKSSDSSNDLKRLANVLKDSIMKFYGYHYILETQDKAFVDDEDARSLTELLDDLNRLIGLETVKTTVNNLIAYQKVQKLRRENNLNSCKNTLHLAFTGNPGTGKTTVARIVGHIYKQIGLLSKGHFVEVSRTDLIAGYQGQTALKVKSIIEKAKGGVLFIDEAYSITENDHSDSYGKECLTELTKALEDYRDDLVVIVAGYTAPMNKFFESNPGLKSRFNTFIEFLDYTSAELENILIEMCKNNDYELSDNALIKIKSFLDDKVAKKDENFSNGRLVRNIYDDLVMNHAKRVVKIENASRENLSVITDEDFVLYGIPESFV